MALIQLKRSSVAGKVPLVADLADGELGLNTADVRLFIKNASGSIVKLSSDAPADVGLGNVNNTSDANKPVSTAQAAAIALKANAASPVFTGTTQAPTPAVDDNSTKIATTAYIISQLSSSVAIMDGTAAAGTSLKLARADHVHPTDTSRAPTVSPTFTGTPAAPTATAGTNTTQLATTAFVKTAVDAAVAGTIDGGAY